MKQDDLHDKRDRDGSGEGTRRTVSTGWVSVTVAAAFLAMGALTYWLMQRDIVVFYIGSVVITLVLGLLLLEMMLNLRRVVPPIKPAQENPDVPHPIGPRPFWRKRAFYMWLIGALFLICLALGVSFFLSEERSPGGTWVVTVVLLGGIWLALLIPNLARSRVLIVFRKLKRLRELADVTELLASAIRCNAFLPDTLERAAVDAPNELTASSLSGIAQDLRQGLSLYEALRKRPRFFPAYYTDLVAVGERSGTLDTVLKDLAVYLSDDIAFRITRRNQLAYIGLLVVSFGSVTVFIAKLVLPQFVVTFDEFGANFGSFRGSLMDLPLNATRAVASTTVIGLCAALATWQVLGLVPRVRRYTSSPRALLDNVFSRLGGFYRRNNLAHIGLLLERLLAGGVTLDVALDDVAQASVSRGYARALTRIKAKVEQGTSLAEALRRERLFSPSFRAMAAVGESSGMLPSCLGHVARRYRQQSNKRARILLDVLLPLCVVIIGLGVMWVAMATLGAVSLLSDTIFYSL